MRSKHGMVWIDSVSTVLPAKIFHLEFHRFDRGFLAMYIAAALQVNVVGNLVNKEWKSSYEDGNMPPSSSA